MNNRLINTKVAGGGGGCTDIVDNYDPFGGNGVALYQLNGDATDSSPNAYNGVDSNVTWGGVGVFGTSAAFNGSSSKIINTSSLVTGNSDRTLSVWMKTSNTTSGMVLATLGSEIGAANNQWAIGFRDGDDDGVIIYGYGQANEVGWGSLGVNVKDGQWHHLAVSWNGSQLSWFVDGSNVLIQPFAHTYATSSGIQIGTWSEDIFWDGEIDQVRVFNTALTPLEVEALYTEELCICDGTVDTLQILGDTSCIATYQLDGNANDLSGNYSGTPTDVSYGVGKFDLAGVFNGSSSYVDLGSTIDDPLRAAGEFGISLWVNINSYTLNNSILKLLNDTYILIIYNSSNEIECRVQDSSDAVKIIKTPVSLNTWYHVVWTGDSTNGVTLYLNGSSVGNTAWNGTYSIYPTPTYKLNNLGYNGGGDGYYDGQIDQVRIFNKGLNSTEVTTLYNETACTKAACSGTTHTLNILGGGDTSCIAAYPLDGSPADLSGNYNGVQTDVTYPQGYFDLAGVFNGSSSIINLPVLGLGGNATRSISAWVNPATTPSLLGTIYHSGGTNAKESFIIYYQSDNKIRVEYDNRGFATTTTILNNTWTHIVATYNGGSIESSANTKIYINGALQTVTTSGSGATGVANTLNTDYAIGYRRYANQFYFDGSIDQVRIFNKALSAGEVTTLYNETPCN